MAHFRTSMPIRFGHEDHARVVYFPRFLHFFHCAFEDLFNENGVTYRQCLEGDKVGWPAVHVESDFISPLRFGDRFDVDVWVSRVGGKSATFDYRGSVAGRLVAKASITVACIDMESFQAQAIPERYRKLFEGFPGPLPPLEADSGPK